MEFLLLCTVTASNEYLVLTSNESQNIPLPLICIQIKGQPFECECMYSIRPALFTHFTLKGGTQM